MLSVELQLVAAVDTLGEMVNKNSLRKRIEERRRSFGVPSSRWFGLFHPLISPQSIRPFQHEHWSLPRFGETYFSVVPDHKLAPASRTTEPDTRPGMNEVEPT